MMLSLLLTGYTIAKVTYKIATAESWRDVASTAPDIALEFLPTGLKVAGKALKKVNYAVQTAHVFGEARTACKVLTGVSKGVKAANYIAHTKGYANAIRDAAVGAKHVYDATHQESLDSN